MSGTRANSTTSRHELSSSFFLLNLRPIVFDLTPFVWLRFFYANLLFLMRIYHFWYTFTFPGTQLGRNSRAYLSSCAEGWLYRTSCIRSYRHCVRGCVRAIEKVPPWRLYDRNVWAVVTVGIYSGKGRGCGRLRLQYDSTRAETRFRLSAKRTSPFKSSGASVQPTAGSRGVRISGSNAGYNMFRGSVKSTGYPLHSPVSPSLPLRVPSHFMNPLSTCAQDGQLQVWWYQMLYKYNFNLPMMST